MSKKVENKKLKINPKRIILIFVALFFVFEAIFYFTLQPWYLGDWYPFDKLPFYLYTTGVGALSVIFCIVSITQTYYIVDKSCIIHNKMGHEYRYRFSEMLYIDEEWSKKHKMLLFYLADGKSKFLAFDRDGIIFDYALTYAVHRMSREEFQSRYPNVRL